jgi:acetyltransferase-like isoleucine patch superfamily enzyme
VIGRPPVLDGFARRVKGAFDDVMPVQWTSQRTLPGQTPPEPNAFARFGADSWIVPSAIVDNAHRVAVGARVVVLEHSVLCVLDEEGDLGSPRLVLGDDVRLARFNTVVCGADVLIGDSVSSSDCVTILSTWRDPFRPTRTLAELDPPPPATVEIGHGAYLGCNSVIYPGVTVGTGAYVGEGAVVTEDVPEHTVVAGNPATAVRRFDPTKREWLATSPS